MWCRRLVLRGEERARACYAPIMHRTCARLRGESTRDALTARIFGTVDLDRKGNGKAGIELLYDLD